MYKKNFAPGRWTGNGNIFRARLTDHLEEYVGIQKIIDRFGMLNKY